MWMYVGVGMWVCGCVGKWVCVGVYGAERVCMVACLCTGGCA